MCLSISLPLIEDTGSCKMTKTTLKYIQVLIKQLFHKSDFSPHNKL